MYRLFTFAITLCFISILPVTAISATPEIKLTGKVIDQYGTPVSGASVQLRQLHFSATTDDNGMYTITKSQSGLHGHRVKNTGSSIGLTPRFLQLGEYQDATVTVLSIRGTVLNRLSVTGRNHVALQKLIPDAIRSQALLLSVETAGRQFTLKTVRCGDHWLVNDHMVIEASQASTTSGDAAPHVDTIITKHDLMQTAATPVSGLVAVVPDIILNYIVEPTRSKDQSLIGNVTITPPSTTFKTSLDVTLSTALTAGEIRYTTDGTLPDSSSPLYEGTPLTLTETTQLRAAVFSTGVQTGDPSTAIFLARTFDYTSDIPIIVMEGYGEGAPEDKYHFIDLGFFSFEPTEGKASFDNTPAIATRAGYHLRGQSSMMMFAQAPYRIELWDNNNDDADYPVCGMPADADWALISPCTDNTLMRNVFAYELGKSIGLETVEWRFVEVFINQDGGPLEPSDYEGIYTIMQPIKNRKNILDLKKLRPEDTSPSKLSGGYIFKFDQMVNDSGMIKLECVGADKMSSMGFSSRRDSTKTCFADLELVSPSAPNQQQLDWITSYIQEFHDALHADPVGDWKKYIDFDSFINLHIVNEVTRDVDGWIRSHFMHKERGEPITAGPLWDYNFTLGNYATDTVGWHVEENRIGSNDWHLMMWEQPDYKTALRIRYQELRKTILSDKSIDSLIDVVKAPINNIAERNFDEWPMGDCSKGSGFGGGGGGFMSTSEITDTTWTGQVDLMRGWAKARLRSLDSSMATLP